MKHITLLIILISLVAPTFGECSKVRCGVIVGACMLQCSCDYPVCECCPECASCLADLFEECCECVDKCDNPFALNAIKTAKIHPNKHTLSDAWHAIRHSNSSSSSHGISSSCQLDTCSVTCPFKTMAMCYFDENYESVCVCHDYQIKDGLYVTH